MMGNLVEITAADGGRFNAYVAMPEGGSGPGLVLLQEAFGVTQFMRDMADRFASDGYVVTVPDLYWRIEAGVELTDAEFDRAMDIYRQFDLNLAIDDIKATIGALRAMPEQRGGVGAVGFCLGGRLAAMAAARTDIDCAVAYYGVGITDHLDELEQVRIPLGFHFGTEDQDCAADIAPIAALAERHDNVSLWMYNKAGHGFANPHRGFFSASAEELAYIRTLAIIRAAIGPKFDLEGMWEQHIYHEFVTKDAHAVLDTMVEEPYVNITSTVMGGVGHDMLLRFYKYHFCDVHPDDTRIIPISRTVGVNRVVDEMIMCFTHDKEISWLLPDIEPTGRYIEVPMIVVVSFRGGKIYNEHIYFDQASVLVQAGLLDPANLPVGGADVSRKLQDKTLMPNRLMKKWSTSEGLPLD
ncbi:dienelactone hydrolase family protein [Sphingobium fluviale]|uniref:Dienelactone hydrolase family protein n=2 Tax=Sphingobium fluviale TaxID=2506423 RepID=A0A4Q1KE16_9SPHN|nr:dienelactone hydrolase family protein [Sphingobium fluviale]